MIKFFCALLTISTIFLYCSTGKDLGIERPINKSKQYLHLSHTRTKRNPLMDSLVEKVDYSKFDMLWLGGDLAYLTSRDDMTMAHIDSIFDVGNINTLWTLGNHDYSDLNRVKRYTKRPPYYAANQDGITLVVLDTQENLSNIADAQKDFLMGILDTVQKSSHLILLHHKLIWMYGNAHLEPKISSISNARLGACSYCVNPNNFNSEIYPKLVEIKKKGVEVVCIGGDIGFHAKEFEYLTPEGIHFLASGITYGQDENKALLFQHNLSDKTLTWDFKQLNDL